MRAKSSRLFFYRRFWSPLKVPLAAMARRLLNNNPRLFNALGIISQRIDARLFGMVPAPECLSTPAEQVRNFGVNVAGFVKGEFGLGAATRAIIRAMEAADVPYVVNNITVPGQSHLDDTVETLSSINPYPVNLIHVNAAEAGIWFRHRRWHDYFQNRYNIGYWFWELSRFPEEWSASFSYHDEIWVATHFCLEAVSKVSPVPVTRMAPSICIDEGSIDARRSRFGLPDDSYVFLFSFDFHGYFKRKNPLALIKAFRTAFSDTDDAVLVLKCINSASYPREREALRKAAPGPRIRLIDTHLRKDDMYSLVAACDCYVSLHRAEGFGLPIAEAMYLGKPVIATGYSGNMDFMNTDNSFPVKHELVEISPIEYPPFRRGYVWADPDVEHAAELMRFVYDNRDRAVKIGAQAAQDMRSLFDPLAAGQTIRKRLETVLADRH